MCVCDAAVLLRICLVFMFVEKPDQAACSFFVWVAACLPGEERVSVNFHSLSPVLWSGCNHCLGL